MTLNNSYLKVTDNLFPKSVTHFHNPLEQFITNMKMKTNNQNFTTLITCPVYKINPQESSN